MCAAKGDVRFITNSDRESGPPHNAMSALPLKADMRQILSNKSSLFVCRIGLICSHFNNRWTRAMPKFSGGCLCGAVRHECNAEPLGMAICHCTHCQKVSGSAFSVNIVVPAPSVTWQGQSASYADTGESGKTAFAKVLPKLWIVTCDRDGSIARGNYHQGGNARRQVLAKTQLPPLD
jgi:hypothetical protein